ncbi:hypothetical protein GCM10027610_061650 [Dactylosporangium cerinum]
MALALTSTPDDPTVQSVSYGPVLLAGQYGAFSQGPNPGSPPAPSPQVLQHLPSLDPASVAPAGTLTFTARADRATVTLRPYFDTHNQHGAVYWTNPTRSGYVRLRNRRSGLIIGVQDMSTSDGAPALQWDDSGTADHGWTFVPDADGAFRIRNQNSGKVLGIQDASTVRGAAALQWNDSGTRDHLWRILVTGNGDQFRLLNVNSNLILGVQDASTTAGATCLQWNDSGTADHLWRLR